MTDVAPASMRLAGEALTQLLTVQENRKKFITSTHTTTDHDKAHRDDAPAEEETASSPLKRTRASNLNDDDVAKNEGGDRDDGDENQSMAPWFAALVRHTKDDAKSKNTQLKGDGAAAPSSANAKKLVKVEKVGQTLSSRLETSPPPPKGSEFTTNWFTHNEHALLRVFEGLGWAGVIGSQPKHVLEVGCWEGRGSQWLLTTLCRHKGSTLTCVDTWEGGVQYHDIGLNLNGEEHTSTAVETRFDANVALVTGVHPGAVSPENPVKKMKGRSTPMLSKLVAATGAGGGGTFDVAYVDGSHHARDVMSDGILCWELLRRGGVMAGCRDTTRRTVRNSVPDTV